MKIAAANRADAVIWLLICNVMQSNVQVLACPATNKMVRHGYGDQNLLTLKSWVHFG